VKPNLFEVRYFAFLAPAILLLATRLVTGVARRGVVVVACAVLLGATLLTGLADQQINRENPRIYDFRGALERVAAERREGDVLVYAPTSLNTVIDYYAPTLDARPLGAEALEVPRGGRLFLLGSFLDRRSTSAAVGGALAELEERATLLHAIGRREQVRVWVFG
jgi:hypothetical protein